MAERQATLYQRLIGGLLGEDLSKLDEEERRRVAGQATSRAVQGLLMGEGLLGGLGGYRRERQADVLRRQQRAEREQRMGAAQQASSQIAGRLLGGMPLPTAPGAIGGDELTGVNVQSAYRRDPEDALRMSLSQAGMDAMQLSPQLAEALKQNVGQQVVGGSIYDRATGQFITPPAPMRGTAAQAAPAQAAPAGPRFRTLSAEDIASAGLPAGTVAQVDEQTGQVKILSAVPATQRTSESEKEKTVQRVDSIAETITGVMDKVATGGPLGVRGALSRVFDSQDAKLFESLRQQLSSAIRAALRIKGEGALSDFEQKQYGLQLPELGLNKENNLLILRSLQNQVRLAAGLDPLPMLEEESPFKVTRED